LSHKRVPILDISTKGLIEIMSLEGVCLDPYLDSVGVWTIGVGITKYDGKDPRSFGRLTIEQAIAMFQTRIKAYADSVRKTGLQLSQVEFDALTSFCYNVGPGNLQKLTHGRSIPEIGTALMLYTRPPEVAKRRQKEQTLYKTGKYSSGNKVLVFPVSENHHPVYSKGYELDVSGYFVEPEAPIPHPASPIPVLPPTAPPPPEGLTFATAIQWIKDHAQRK
jgi:lysozyme